MARDADAGLTLAWVPEKLGGAGASLADGFAILGAAGRYALPVPLAETLLAGWLLAQAGIEAPAGAMTVAPARPRDRIVERRRNVERARRGIPFAKKREHIAFLATGDKGTAIALVKAGDCRVGDGENLAGEPSTTSPSSARKPSAARGRRPVSMPTALMLMGAPCAASKSPARWKRSWR